MNRTTAMQIVGNPLDLRFVIDEVKEPGPNGSWYVAVYCGRVHNFKPLLSTDQPGQLRPTRDDALWVVEMGVLYLALAGVQIPEGDESMARVSSAEGQDAKRAAIREAIEKAPRSPEGCLTLSMVDRIMAVLTEKGECLTSELEPTSKDLAGACQEILSEEDCSQLAEMPLDEAIGYSFTLLAENGIEDPEAFLKQKGFLE